MVVPKHLQNAEFSLIQHHLALLLLCFTVSFCHSSGCQYATTIKVADLKMIMFAIKRALKLNNAEATLMIKHAGFRRVVYNMGLSLRMQLYGGEFKCSDAKVIAGVRKVLTNHVKKRPEFAWMNELSSKVYQSALQDLQTAFIRYRKRLAEHPVFASRKDGQSFTVYDGNGKVCIPAGYTLKIPTLGTFRLYEPLAERYITQTFTVSKDCFKGGR